MILADAAPLLAVLFTTGVGTLAVAGGVASVPVLIHLLSRRRYRVVEWAATRFLLAARKRNTRRMRLEQWLLLALRTLALLLVVLAMASVMPWAERLWSAVLPGRAPAAVGGEGRTHKVLVLDGSFSMALRDGDATLFDRARAKAERVLESAAAGDGFSVVVLGSPGQTLVPGPADDADKVRAELRALRQPHGGADLGPGLNAVAEVLRRSPDKFAQREVYFLTDLQRSLWGHPALSAARPTAPGEESPAAAPGADSWQQVRSSPRTRLIWVDVGKPDADNLAVTGLALADPLVITGAPVAITATVQNFGAAERKDVRAELRVGKARSPDAPADGPFALQTVAREVVTASTGNAATVAFQHAFRQPGEYVVQVRLDAGDDLDLDDARSLAVTVRDGVPVLLVDGRPGGDEESRAAYYLAKALNPFPEKERSPLHPARPRVIREDQFADAALGDLTPYDCVFLCDVPRLSEREAARLEAHLRRGGGVVFTLGPGVDLEAYNRLLWRDGAGLLPGRLAGVASAPKDKPFGLDADEESFAQPPLAAFAADNARAGLLAPRFRKYVRVESAPRGPARRVLSFLPSPGDSTGVRPASRAALDPVVLEWPRFRGRVVLVTTPVNADWSTWPLSPSFPPLMQEVMRLAVLGPPRRVGTAGEPLEEFLPAASAGLEATVVTPDGRSETVPVVARDDGAALKFTDTDQSGVYRAAVGRQEFLYAVNVPSSNGLAGSESDLHRIDPGELTASAGGADAQIVTDPADVVRRALAGPPPGADMPVATLEMPSVWGRQVARWLLLAVLVILPVEMVLAWWFGSARALRGASGVGETLAGETRSLGGLASFGLVPALLVAGIAFVLAHAALTGQPLGFLPGSWRSAAERGLGVPPAAVGEGTRWRLDGVPAFVSRPRADAWVVGTLLAGALALTCFLYVREAMARHTLPTEEANGRWRPSAWVTAGLRAAFLFLLLAVLLPQLGLAFEREGWPDVAVLIDDSKSMGTADKYADPAVRDKAAEIARSAGLSEPQRLALAKALLAHPSQDWLSALLTRRQQKVHVYHCSSAVRKLAEVTAPAGLEEAAKRVNDLKPDGDSSQLGSAVRAVLNDFRGSSLSAVVVLTDGVNTEGEDLPAAGRFAAQAGVPLYVLGIGDAVEPPDLSIHDVQSEDAVFVNDRLVFEGKFTARGAGHPASLPVTLKVRKADGTEEVVATAEVRPDAGGKPVKFRLTHTPTEPGEKTYIIDVPVQPGESEAANNRVERVVAVTEARRLKVLYVEGYPRYDFRFVKSLLERESSSVKGNKSVELRVLLLDADPQYPAQDRSAVGELPNREELWTYDVILVGDIDPKHPKLGEKALQMLADFVKEKGGGMLFLAGSQNGPHALRDTLLADVMPVIPEGDGPPEKEDAPLAVGYRPRLTPAGQNHPAFRFVSEEAANAEVWNGLAPLLWASGGYKKKAAAEVLATHPDRPGAGEEGFPIMLQQFVGGGRVLFLGFDETWRWRLREDELRFNQFWVQAVRYLARNRVGRVELRTDKQTAYRRGEPVRLTVRFPDDAPPPPADAPVRVLVERSPLKKEGGAGGTEAQTVQLAKVEGTRATYESLLTRTPEGEYRFTLTGPTGAGTRTRAEARVLPPPGELDRLRADQPAMERAASESRGKFYTLADADKLIDDLPAGRRVALNQPRPPLLLWNHPLTFAICLLLLAGEWVLRKARGWL